MINTIQFPTAVAPITQSGEFISHSNVDAIALQNVGTSTAILFDGLWTILPKATLTINITKDDAFLDTGIIRVTFDTTLGSSNRLEVLLIKSKVC